MTGQEGCKYMSYYTVYIGQGGTRSYWTGGQQVRETLDRKAVGTIATGQEGCGYVRNWTGKLQVQQQLDRKTVGTGATVHEGRK